MRSYCCLLLLLLGSVSGWASNAIIVDNETGCILEEHGSTRKVSVASLTKIALAVTLLDWTRLSKTSLDLLVTVPPNGTPQGASNPLGLEAGDKITLRDLLYLALLVSDSEAARTIATVIGAKVPKVQGLSAVENCVAQMNALARGLNMRRTLFLNPSGLDMPDGQAQPYSTAADLARLVRYAYAKPGFAFYVSQKIREIHVERGGKSFAVKIENTNKLLGVDDIDGVKTGRTAQAGECVILTSEHTPEVKREGTTVFTAPRRIIVVLLGANADRFQEGRALVGHGWDLYNKWAAAGRQLKGHRFL